MLYDYAKTNPATKMIFHLNKNLKYLRTLSDDDKAKIKSLKEFLLGWVSIGN